MKITKKCVIWLIIISLIFGGLKIYLVEFTASPQKAVENYINAYTDLDINKMLKYIDPAAAPMFRGATSVASTVIGALTGFKLDIGTLVDVMPLLSTITGDADTFTSIAPPKNFRIVSYSPAFAPGIANILIFFIPEFVNVIADEAVVSFDFNGHRYRITVANFGADGWRIPLNSNIVQVF